MNRHFKSPGIHHAWLDRGDSPSCFPHAKTPARAQAARWWGQESSGRPHWQARAVKGRRSRRKEIVREQLGGIFVSLRGAPWDNANPARGPPGLHRFV